LVIVFFVVVVGHWWGIEGQNEGDLMVLMERVVPDWWGGKMYI
jgi:hypothetical protein